MKQLSQTQVEALGLNLVRAKGGDEVVLNGKKYLAIYVPGVCANYPGEVDVGGFLLPEFLWHEAEENINQKQKQNLLALESFYGMKFKFDSSRKEYLCLSPSGVLLFKYSSAGDDRLFSMICGELVPSDLR